MADRTLRADLRTAVHRLRKEQRRHHFPVVLHLGDLTSEAVTWSDDGTPCDVGLRTEIAAALLSRALLTSSTPAVWMTRPGWPLPHDADTAWLLGPVRRVLSEADVEPRCLVVVTKNGWYDPVSGEAVVWERLRIRPRR